MREKVCWGYSCILHTNTTPTPSAHINTCTHVVVQSYRLCIGVCFMHHIWPWMWLPSYICWLPLLVPMHGVWGKETGGLVQVFNCCSDEWRTAMFVLKKEAGSCGAYVLWSLVRSSWSHPHYPMHCQCEDTLSLARTKRFCNWHTLQESPNLRGPNITDPEGLGGYLHGDVWCTYGATVAVHDLTFQVQMHCLREVLQSFP